MTFMTKHRWPVYGHDWAVEFLQTSLKNRRNRHAYLITGTNNIGKNQLAHAFAMALNCETEDAILRPCGECRSCRLINSGNHPDMIYSERDERTGALKIDTIRDVMRLLALKPFSSRYRIAIFDGFDNAQPRAQDALLKTLEEPSQHAILLLLAQSTENIMPTIRSRCQIIPLRPVPQETVKQVLLDDGAEEEQASFLAGLSSGRVGWALKAYRDEVVMQEREDMLNRLSEVIQGNRAVRFRIAEDLDKIAKKDKQAMELLLEQWQSYWRDALLLAENSPVKPCNTDRKVELQQLVQMIQPKDALRALQATRTMLNATLKTNANVRMAFEVLFLDYPGLH
jgi:DNA polymerase-3 subunit delta'